MNITAKRLNIAAAMSMLLIATSVRASNADYGIITFPLGTLAGAVLFTTSGARTTPPTCGAANAQRFALDTSTVAGQQQATVLLQAYAQNKRVYIAGTGTCSLWGDTETVNYFQVEESPPLTGDFSKIGHISSTYLSGATNFAFRVTLDVAMPECVSGFAYINKSSDNYSAYVASLISAYYAGKQVNLAYKNDASGYCQITDFNVS